MTRHNDLVELLGEVLGYLENRADVDNHQRPNEAMALSMRLEDVLYNIKRNKPKGMDPIIDALLPPYEDVVQALRKLHDSGRVAFPGTPYRKAKDEAAIVLGRILWS